MVFLWNEFRAWSIWASLEIKKGSEERRRLGKPSGKVRGTGVRNVAIDKVG